MDLSMSFPRPATEAHHHNVRRGKPPEDEEPDPTVPFTPASLVSDRNGMQPPGQPRTTTQ